MRFDKYDIHPKLKENLVANGFFRTTDIQYKTIPAILDGEDVLAVAQTGSGKTAAFAIPIIDQILLAKKNKTIDGIYCLVLVPTRELAQQIGRVFTMLATGTSVKVATIHGGVNEDPQIEQLESGVEVLIATPGRMFDLMRQEYIHTNSVRFLVLDEADRMLDLGFIRDIEAVKARLRQRHQTLFFSATINTKIKRLAYSQIRANALRIQVSPAEMVSKNITHTLVRVSMDDKRVLLLQFVRANPQAKAIVFVRTQVRAERVSNWLAKNEVGSVSMHGGMSQTERDANLERFRGHESGVLIATDVSARGIDLPGITHVVNYDMPDDPENYVHRIGRTGRGFAKGQAVSFCSPEETEKLAAIEEMLEREIPEQKVEQSLLKIEDPGDISKMSMDQLLESASAGFKEKKRGKKRK